MQLKKLSHVPLSLDDFCLAHLWPIPARCFVLLYLFITAAATIRLSPFFFLIPDTPDFWSLALGNVICNSQVRSLPWWEQLLFMYRHCNSLTSGKTCGGAGIEYTFFTLSAKDHSKCNESGHIAKARSERGEKWWRFQISNFHYTLVCAV